mmetsp:Transcript_59468/g.143535  ORF Transcript_59468/g.143535 Transcript_59468/m.143535 type:complete len:86 (-) Transcript_59468:89-346(-)
MPWLEALKVLRGSAEDLRRPLAEEERVQEGPAEEQEGPAEELVREGQPRADVRGKETPGLPPGLERCAPTPSQTKVLMLVDTLTH